MTNKIRYSYLKKNYPLLTNRYSNNQQIYLLIELFIYKSYTVIPFLNLIFLHGIYGSNKFTY